MRKKFSGTMEKGETLTLWVTRNTAIELRNKNAHEYIRRGFVSKLSLPDHSKHTSALL